MNKKTNVRIQHKIDTYENWEKAIGFKPLDGEMIIFTSDENHNYPTGIKIGKNNLPLDELEFVIGGPNFISGETNAIQSDWLQDNNAQLDFIKNKPGDTIITKSNEILTSFEINENNTFTNQMTGLYSCGAYIDTSVEFDNGSKIILNILPDDITLESELYTDEEADIFFEAGDLYTGYYTTFNLTSKKALEAMTNPQRQDETIPYGFGIVVYKKEINDNRYSLFILSPDNNLENKSIVIEIENSKKEYIKLSNNALNIDSEPLENSNNFVNSGSLYTTLNKIKTDIDEDMTIMSQELMETASQALSTSLQTLQRELEEDISMVDEKITNEIELIDIAIEFDENENPISASLIEDNFTSINTYLQNRKMPILIFNSLTKICTMLFHSRQMINNIETLVFKGDFLIDEDTSYPVFLFVSIDDTISIFVNNIENEDFSSQISSIEQQHNIDVEELNGKITTLEEKHDNNFNTLEEMISSLEDITDNLLNTEEILNTHNKDIQDIKDTYDEKMEILENIAAGKCKTYVFDTKAALDSAIEDYKDNNLLEGNPLYGITLKTGDMFLIKATDIPDYWWDDNSKNIYPLEARKFSLDEYVTKEEFNNNIPTDYVTQNEFNTHKTEANNTYAKKSDIPTDYITQNEFNTHKTEANNTYAKKGDIPTSLPANGGNANTINGKGIRIVSEDDGGLEGYITFVVG